MDKQVVFKTAAIGGFDKKAVLDYIYALTQRAEEQQARLEKQASGMMQEKADLQSELDAAKAEAERLRDSAESARAELEGERRRIRELGELVSSQEEEIDRQKQLVAERSAQMDEFVRQNGEISEKNKELEKNRMEVELASAQIGKLLIDAHTDAERILREAQEKAGDMIAQAKAKADEILMDAGTQAERTISEASETAKHKIESAQKAVDTSYEKFSVFRAEISRLQKGMMSVLEEIHFKAGEISESIDEAQDAMHHVSQPIMSYEAEEYAMSYMNAAEEAETEEAKDDSFFRFQ